ncbi:MAG TPA: M48 family metallopeptidase, partial [Cyclobacteriaceae bacterium]|nr:M48 family metallopeptidase [Cyclobacteriaceae bacterium]
MGGTALLYLILAILVLEFLLSKFLEFLNYKSLKEALPESLKGIYEEEKYAKSIAYNRANSRFSFLVSTLSFILVLILIITGSFGRLDTWLREYVGNEIALSLAFFGILAFAGDILSTPFNIYDTFVIEENFGFNKTTPRIYFIDKIKGYFLSGLIGGGLLSLLLIMISRLGPSFWIFFWIAFAVFVLFMNMFYTTLILPLFNKLSPLEDGELKTRIREYSEKVKFPLDNIFVIDGSKRSTKSNAFFSGIGKKKKIVLYDTLIRNHPVDELIAVLAHEVGHYKKKHILRSYLLSLAQTGLLLFLMSRILFNPELSAAFGASAMGIHINLLVFAILISPLNHLLGISMN